MRGPSSLMSSPSWRPGSGEAPCPCTGWNLGIIVLPDRAVPSRTLAVGDNCVGVHSQLWRVLHWQPKLESRDCPAVLSVPWHCLQ